MRLAMRNFLLPACTFALILYGDVILAAPNENKAAIQRLQAQLRLVTQQKSDAERDKADLAAQVEASKAKLSHLQTAEAKRRAAEAALEKLRTEHQASLDALREAQQRADTEAKLHADLAHELAQTKTAREQENKRAEMEAAARSKQIAACETKNAKLYQISRDLIANYQSQRGFEAILRSEPFTQIGKVSVENMLEDTRDKVDAERIYSRDERKN